jgi:RNA polymerase sigma factor (sigma-70 family)
VNSPERQNTTERNAEAGLLARAKGGQEEAWAQLHREHYPKIWNSVNRILNNPSHADDVTQQAFVKAWKEIGRFEGQSQFGTWLYRIAVNQSLDFVRRQRRREQWLTFFSPVKEDDAPPPPDAVEEAKSSQRLEADDLRRQIQAAMADLSPEHRAVVQLRLIDELSLAETAEILKCRPGTVNSRLFYACEHLRRKLGKLNLQTP